MLSLHRLPLSYRILYTGVLLFMTAGTVAHGAHQWTRIGILPGDIRAWYLGNEDDPAAAILLFPRSFEETLGDAWLSITAYTVALLVLGGILMRSDARPRVQGGLLAGFAALALLASAAPLLVRYGAPWFAPVYTLALLALPLLAAAVTGVAVRDMWLRRAAGPRFDPGRTV